MLLIILAQYSTQSFNYFEFSLYLFSDWNTRILQYRQLSPTIDERQGSYNIHTLSATIDEVQESYNLRTLSATIILMKEKNLTIYT